MSIFRMPRRNQKPVVVIEIGNDWLKILEGQSLSTGIVMTKASFRKLAQINEPINLAILQIAKQLKLNTKNVFTYIPRHLITVRILELPSTNPSEIDAMIHLQIGKQTPYSKDEIVFSYKIIESGKEGYTKVMLVIAKRNIISERLEVLLRAGIKVQNVTFSSEGVHYWFKEFYLSKIKVEDSQAVMLVDIDSNFSDFLIFQKQKMIFTKNILLGANHLENKLEGHRSKFIDEMKHSLDVFHEEWRGVKAVQLFLSGAMYGLKEDMDLISVRLGVPCEIIHPLNSVQLKNKGALVEEARFKFLSFSAALGFFMKAQHPEFNLLSQEIRVQKSLESKRKSLTVVGILLGAIILALSLLILIHIDNKNVRLQQIKQQAEKLKDISTDVEKMRSLISLFQERLDASGDPLNLLNDIYEVTPSKIYLTEINIQRKGTLSMKGRATAMSEVFKYVNLLENLPSLQSVQNNYATMNKENKDEYSTDFEITAVYQKSNDQP